MNIKQQNRLNYVENGFVRWFIILYNIVKIKIKDQLEDMKETLLGMNYPETNILTAEIHNDNC